MKNQSEQNIGQTTELQYAVTTAETADAETKTTVVAEEAANAQSSDEQRKNKRKIQAKAATKNTVIAALFSALCIVLPMAFHAVPQGGLIFCPMHIPVLLAGLICGWQYGLVVGIVGPTLSMLTTGMPPLATLPSMLIECAVYGLVSGLLMKFVRTGHVYADMYVSLIVAMLAGRIIGGICKALFFTDGEYTIAAWATAYFVKALPGIVMHLALIPSVVFALMKARVTEERYPKIKNDGRNDSSSVQSQTCNETGEQR